MPLGDNFTELIETSFNSNPFNKCHGRFKPCFFTKAYTINLLAPKIFFKFKQIFQKVILYVRKYVLQYGYYQT